MRALAAIALAASALTGCTGAPAPAAWDWDLPASLPVPSVPADNPMSVDKVELGRHLFYDPRLSGNGTQACASCHAQERAFTDGRATAIGSTGEHGRRSSQGLANVAYRSSLTWANPSVRTLEEQALVPMFGDAPVELGIPDQGETTLARLAADPTYQALFPAAFPDDADPFTIANVTRAIASFERTILSGSSRFDRHELTLAEQRGFELFASDALGCKSCHGGFDFTTAVDDKLQFFNTGLYATYPDRGLADITGDPTHAGRFRPPSLRNVAVTAPYMHDGSVATLEEVVDIYAAGGRGDGAHSPAKSPLVHGFSLTPAQRADLVAFLDALTDDTLLTDPALADPWP